MRLVTSLHYGNNIHLCENKSPSAGYVPKNNNPALSISKRLSYNYFEG